MEEQDKAEGNRGTKNEKITSWLVIRGKGTTKGRRETHKCRKN
jgi:hypothetical protein